LNIYKNSDRLSRKDSINEVVRKDESIKELNKRESENPLSN